MWIALGMNSRRYYTNQLAGIPLSEQDEMAARDGLKEGGPLYPDTRRSFPREKNKCFESFRPERRNEHVWVSDFVVLVPFHKYLKPILKALKKANAYIFEGRTGRSSKDPAQYAAMLHDALDYWKRGRLPHHRAVEYGRQGGEQFAENRKAADRRMPKGEAMKYWLDPKYGSEEALAAINSHRGYKEKWSRSAAFRPKDKGGLGPRGLPSGPRGPWKR